MTCAMPLIPIVVSVVVIVTLHKPGGILARHRARRPTPDFAGLSTRIRVFQNRRTEVDRHQWRPTARANLSRKSGAEAPVSCPSTMLHLARSKVSPHGGEMSAVSAPTGPAPAAEARGQFFGSTREYWHILSRDALALIVTLGLYRFWVSTDVRRYLWSHTNLAGEQLDYTGDPLELLVGFLLLLVVLAPLVAIVAVVG